MEKNILADGWVFKSQIGSHKHYSHPSKPGKVTIPFHGKDLPKGTERSILKQAGLI
nr:type II toxin-antitoxin system HicA family toxin [Lacrimispora celerecrescens]